jgi:hypothetical protein
LAALGRRFGSQLILREVQLMPCRYLVALDGKVVLERWTGTVTRHELMTHKQQQVDDPSIKLAASVLSDCTGAVFAIAPEEISALSAMDKDPDSTLKIRRYAFLVNNDTYDKARQFSDQVNQYGKSVIIFNSLDVAASWLGLDALRVRELMGNIGG